MALMSKSSCGLLAVYCIKLTVWNCCYVSLDAMGFAVWSWVLREGQTGMGFEALCFVVLQTFLVCASAGGYSG